MSVDDVVDEVDRIGCPLVEITGGEPLLQDDVYPLMAALLARGLTVLLETGGHISLDRVPAGVVKIVDVKCPASGESARNHWPNLDAAAAGRRGEVRHPGPRRLRVRSRRRRAGTSSPATCAAVLFSPVHGVLAPPELAAWILADTLPVRLQLQVHKYIWGARARGASECVARQEARGLFSAADSTPTRPPRWRRPRASSCYALTVAYGQRHAVELEAARRVAAALGVARHVELQLDLSRLRRVVADRSGAPCRRTARWTSPASRPPTCPRATPCSSRSRWRGRSRSAPRDIFIGVNALDYSGYPDCRPEFIEAFERTAALATKAGVEGARFRIHTPLINMTKAEIIRAGSGARPRLRPDHSCYDPGPGGAPCGHCDSCVLRARGFAEAGVPDPGSKLDACRRRLGAEAPGYTAAVLRTAGRLRSAHRDRTHLLHRSGLPRVRRHRHRLVDGRRPARRGARSHGVLSDLRRPAVRYGCRRRRRGHRRRRPGGRIDRSRGERAAWRRASACTAASTGPAASTTCSSTPASTSCRRRSTGCTARAPSAFTSGPSLSTLDLDKVLSPESMAAAESEANRIVWEDRPVSIRFATPEEAAAMALRKEPTRHGPLRVIDVEGFDLSACGGTHVARAGQVGVIALRSWEKFRGGVRLEFVCGGRALREFRLLRDAVAGSLRFLSVAPQDLPSAIEGAQADNKDLRRTLRGLHERLAVHEASALVDRALPVGAARVIVDALDGWDQAGLEGAGLVGGGPARRRRGAALGRNPGAHRHRPRPRRRPRRVGGAQGHAAAVRRERRRQAGAGAGRRPRRRARRHDGRARSAHRVGASALTLIARSHMCLMSRLPGAMTLQ